MGRDGEGWKPLSRDDCDLLNELVRSELGACVVRLQGSDKYLLKYIKNDDINYLIVANDFNIFKSVCKNNNYNKYLLKEFLINLVMRDLK